MQHRVGEIIRRRDRPNQGRISSDSKSGCSWSKGFVDGGVAFTSETAGGYAIRFRQLSEMWI